MSALEELKLGLADISDKGVSRFVTFLDIAIRHGRENGWSDQLILLGVRNRLDVGRTIEATSFDKDGNPLPDRKPDGQAFADEVTDWQAVVKRFYQRLRARRIPAAEVEAAQPSGTPAWRALMKRWGAEVAPDAGQERGERNPGMTPRETAPGEPAAHPGESVIKRARAAGKPVKNYTDYKTAKAEFGKGAA